MNAAITREQLVALLRKAVDIVDSLHCCADDLAAAGSALDDESSPINGDHMLPCPCDLCAAGSALDDAKNILDDIASEVAELHRETDAIMEVQP